MHKHKKTIGLALGLLMVLSLALTGCSGGAASSAAQANAAPAGAASETGSAGSEAAGVPAGAPAALEDDYVMTLGLSGGLCEAATQMAIVNGYFEEEGVRYELINYTGTTDVPTLLASGQVDANQMMLAQVSVLMNSGFDIRISSGLHKGCLAIAVPADSDIESVADLKGKTIGVPGLGSTPMIISQRVLSRAGIDPTAEAGEVEFLAFNGGDLPVALANGSVDAVAVIEPTASVLTEAGAAKVIFNLGTDPDYKDEYCCVVALNTQFAEAHPEVAAAYTRALQKACEFIRQNPAETAQLQYDNDMCNLGNLEVNARLLDSYNYKGSVSGGREALLANMKDIQALGLLDEQYDVDAIIDTIYIELPGVENEIDLDL